MAVTSKAKPRTDVLEYTEDNEYHPELEKHATRLESAMVARLVPEAEILKEHKAKESIETEWNKLLEQNCFNFDEAVHLETVRENCPAGKSCI